MSIEGVDYSVARPKPSELYKAGKRFACRYLYGTLAGKAVTRSEIDALRAAGLAVVLNWEWSASEATGGYDTGVDRGRRTKEIVAHLGAPADAAVYFSVDYDARDMGPVREYFRGITSVWPKARTGVYGGRRVIETAKLQGWCPWYWQTYAWSGGVWVPGAHIQQYRNGVNFQGSDLDLDRALVADYGQWRAEDDMPTAQEIAEAVWVKQIVGGDGKTTYAASSFLRSALIAAQITLPQQISGLEAALDAIASRVDIDPAELEAIKQAAREGAGSVNVGAVVDEIGDRLSNDPPA